MYSNEHTYYVTLLGVIGTDIKFMLAKAEIVYVYANVIRNDTTINNFSGRLESDGLTGLLRTLH